jgi:hypothetical protein
MLTLDPEALAVALSLTLLLGVRAPGYFCRRSTIVDMSAGAAAGGAACTSVGARLHDHEKLFKVFHILAERLHAKYKVTCRAMTEKKSYL